MSAKPRWHAHPAQAAQCLSSLCRAFHKTDIRGVTLAYFPIRCSAYRMCHKPVSAMTDISLKERISSAVKDAMRARASERLGTLRLLQAAIKQKEVDERRELSDTDITAILEKQVKQRRESIAAYEQAGRAETAAQERAEITVLQEFLPQAASPEEISAAIDAAIAAATAQGVSGAPAMGVIMAELKQKLAGRADMGALSKDVKARL